MSESGTAQRISDLAKIFASGKAGHAYLFLGPGGSKKEEAVRDLAKILLCLSAGEKPCNTCRSCLLLTGGNHPDFRVVGRDEDSVKVEEMREVCREAAYTPYLSGKKIYFFPDFSRLTEVAANAFLKTLEEPPSGVIFLALAGSEAEILPTVLSRMQRVHLYFAEETAKTGEAGAGGEEEEALLASTDLLALFRAAEKWEKKDRSEVDEYLRHLAGRFRKELIADPWNPDSFRILQAIRRSRDHLAANVNLRLLLEDLFLTVYEVRNRKGSL